MLWDQVRVLLNISTKKIDHTDSKREGSAPLHGDCLTLAN